MVKRTDKPPASAGRTLTSSWQLLRQSVILVRHRVDRVIILALLPSLALQLGSILVTKYFGISMAIVAVSLLWLLANTPVLYYFEVQASRGKSQPIGTIYTRGLPYFWNIMGFSVVYGLMVIVGLICFIVPGLILFRRYALAPYYIVDHGMSIGEAMRRSSAVTKPVAGYIWGSTGVALSVGLAASVAGLAFAFAPGLGSVVSSCLSLAALFVLPLRYVEVATRAGD